VLRRFLGSALALLACCSRPLAPLPSPPPEAVVDPAASSFGGKVAEDARRIEAPPWATLIGVFGLYDPPFVTTLHEVTRVVFGRDERELVLLRDTGELVFWDRIAHVTRNRFRACVSGPLANEVKGAREERAEILVTGPDERFAAIGFSSGRYCVLDVASGKKTADIQANDLDPSRFGIMVARLLEHRLVTYAYQPETTTHTSLRSVRDPEAGGELRSWDATSGRMLSNANVGGALSADLSADGKRLALVRMKRNVAGTLALTDERGAVLWTSGELARSIVFAGSELILASDGSRLFMLSAADGRSRGELEGFWRPSRDYPWRDVAVTRNGSHAVSAFGDGRFALWDLAARREVKYQSWSMHQVPSLHEAVASHDGALFVASDASIFATARLELIEAPSGPIECLATSDDGERAIACRRDGRQRVFDVWDAKRRQLRRWPRRDVAIVSLAADGTRVLVRERGSNELRDWATGRVIWSAPHHLWAPAALAPNGGRFAVLTWNQHRNAFDTVLRDAATSGVVWTNERERPSDRVLAFSPDGARIIVRDHDFRLVVLDAATGSVRRRIALPEGDRKGASNGLARAVFIDTHRVLLVGGYGEALTAFDVETGTSIWHVDETISVDEVAGLDAEHFVAITKRSVSLRNSKTGRDVAPPIDFFPSDDGPRHVAVSTDGRLLTVGTQRGVLIRFQLTAE
jgi:outer membrane protein assembly factor BamB